MVSESGKKVLNSAINMSRNFLFSFPIQVCGFEIKTTNNNSMAESYIITVTFVMLLLPLLVVSLCFSQTIKYLKDRLSIPARSPGQRRLSRSRPILHRHIHIFLHIKKQIKSTKRFFLSTALVFSVTGSSTVLIVSEPHRSFRQLFS